MPTKGTCQSCGGPTATNRAVLCKPCDIIKRRRTVSKQEYGREWNQIKKYGIDNMGFDVLWQVFKGKCGICGIDLIMPTYTRGQPLNAAVIDHDHTTNNLRGLLCNGCNKGVGLLKDDPAILINAAKWVTTKWVNEN